MWELFRQRKAVPDGRCRGSYRCGIICFCFSSSRAYFSFHRGLPSAQNGWSSLGGLDKFKIGEGGWILRPPAADLKLVLEALSPGLDGWPLQRLNELAQELIACGNDEEPMVPVCQEMRGLLQNVFEALCEAFIPSLNQEDGMVDMCLQMWGLEVVLKALDGSSSLHALLWGNVSLEVVLAMGKSGTVEHVWWAFTWVETLLLEHDMLGVRSSEVTVMRTIRDRWHKVHLCMPSGLPQTEVAVDFHRRSALLACGQEREAVCDYKAPDSIFKGFEACFLCMQTAAMYHYGFRKPGKPSYGYGWSQLRDKFLWWIERAATAGPQHHEHWPLVRLHVIVSQMSYFNWVGRRDLANEVLGNALAELEQIDLELRFDFPVPQQSCLQLPLPYELIQQRAS